MRLAYFSHIDEHVVIVLLDWRENTEQPSSFSENSSGNVA